MAETRFPPQTLCGLLRADLEIGIPNPGRTLAILVSYWKLGDNRGSVSNMRSLSTIGEVDYGGPVM